MHPRTLRKKIPGGSMRKKVMFIDCINHQIAPSLQINCEMVGPQDPFDRGYYLDLWLFWLIFAIFFNTCT